MAFRGARCEEWNSRCLSTVVNGRLGVEGRDRGLDLNQISQQEADTLELPFTEEEEEILEMFKEFHEQKAFLKSLNTTFLVLIPKKGGAEELGILGRSGLVGGLYKLLAKILDASLIANEVIDSWKKRGETGLICKAVEGGCISGAGSKGQGAGCEYLPFSFADDAIVFWEVEEILEMAVELGCKVGKLPSTYLGCPWVRPIRPGACGMGGGKDEVVARTRKVARDFLWGGGSMERKAHLVNWERVCVGKEKGGLGLRKLIPLNKALLGKWVWRFANAKEEMWKRVLVAKYGQEEFGWRTKKVNGAFGVGVWKEIMKEADWCWDKMNLRSEKAPKSGLEGPLCGEVELARRFPQLFIVAAQRSATVGEAFGWRTFPSKLAFFAWEATWGGFSRLIGYKREGGSFLIAAIYVAWMRKTSTISFYIVQWLECYGDRSWLSWSPMGLPRNCKGETEEETCCFSPRFDAYGGGSHTYKKLKIEADTADPSITVFEFKLCPDSSSNRLSIADVQCTACKQLLFRPVVLNCGHVYCETCFNIPVDERFRCEVCQVLHPSGFLKVCLELDHFLEEQFPEEYALRREAVQLKAVHLHDAPSTYSCQRVVVSNMDTASFCPSYMDYDMVQTYSCLVQEGETTRVIKLLEDELELSDPILSSKNSGIQGFKWSSVPKEEYCTWLRDNGPKIHLRVGCDSCGVNILFPLFPTCVH
ncbi:E3 ubiquitin-protein ligase PRT1 [Vitis vinifera]|uniref:E3 ubiquitin-protein ligase PRT1 n=1 Tax=Vitis vinifera TaxID=29760 RepID=A0A438G9G2_VITVI|nr:E3 ubiquitin-protein ligase PRT1 [Vitis vinifera]